MTIYHKFLWIGIFYVAFLSLISCGPGKPGSQTPKLPPAALWDLHTEAGHVAVQEGRLPDAEQHFLAALKEAEELKIVSPENHQEVLAGDPSLPTSLNNLGILYTKQERYDDAARVLRRALSISETNLDQQHPYIAVTLRNLGTLHRHQEQYDEAEGYVRRALDIDAGALGTHHPQLAKDYTQLAAIASARGLQSEAELYLKKGLSLRQQAYGPDHPEVAISLLAMADGYRDHDQFDQAEPLYERVLEIQEKHFGPRHLQMAESLEHYALLAKKMGRPQEAEEMQREAQQIRSISEEPSSIQSQEE